MPQEFDPKLKEAAKEIQQVLNKYDAMGAMLLVSPTHCEYLFEFNTSWSVMKFEHPPDPERSKEPYLRFRSKKEDYKSKEDQGFCTESTVHAVTSFLQFGRMVQSNMQQIIELLKTKMKIGYAVWK